MDQKKKPEEKFEDEPKFLNFDKHFGKEPLEFFGFKNVIEGGKFVDEGETDPTEEVEPIDPIPLTKLPRDWGLRNLNSLAGYIERLPPAKINYWGGRLWWDESGSMKYQLPQPIIDDPAAFIRKVKEEMEAKEKGHGDEESMS